MNITRNSIAKTLEWIQILGYLPVAYLMIVAISKDGQEINLSVYAVLLGVAAGLTPILRWVFFRDITRIDKKSVLVGVITLAACLFIFFFSPNVRF